MAIFGDSQHARGRFYDTLAVTIDAGLPIDRALSTLSEHDGRFAAAAGKLRASVSHGLALSDGMARQDDLFSLFEVHVVEAGERAGRLPDSLVRLARTFEARGRARDRIGAGLLYPILLLHGAVLLPPLFILFRDSLGAYLGTVGPILLAIYAAVAAVWGLYRALTRDDDAKARIDGILVGLPFVGKMARAFALADYAHAFATLYASGVPIVETLEKSAQVTRNGAVRAAGIRVARSVETGSTVYEGLMQERRLFTNVFLETILAGETAGKLDEALEKAEKVARDDADRMLRSLAVALPTLAYIIAAIVVAYVVISFWTDMASSIKGI